MAAVVFCSRVGCASDPIHTSVCIYVSCGGTGCDMCVALSTLRESGKWCCLFRGLVECVAKA